MNDIQIIELPWDFDSQKFYTDVMTWCNDNDTLQQEIGPVIGLDKSYVSQFKQKGRYPTMRNFLSVCYLCDLDPRDYFYIVPVPQFS